MTTPIKIFFPVVRFLFVFLGSLKSVLTHKVYLILNRKGIVLSFCHEALEKFLQNVSDIFNYSDLLSKC